MKVWATIYKNKESRDNEILKPDTIYKIELKTKKGILNRLKYYNKNIMPEFYIIKQIH